MTNLKKRVASHKILQFLQNNKVIFFFQKKSVQSDHWRLLKKKIVNIEGVATLNLKNKRDRKQIQPLILSRVFSLKKTSLITNANQALLAFGEEFTNPLQEKSIPCLWQDAPYQRQEAPLQTKDASLTSKQEVTALFNYSCCLSQENTLSREPCVYEKDPRRNLHLEGENKVPSQQLRRGLKVVKQISDLLYAPNLILGSNSLEKLVGLSHQLKEDSNLVFIGGWDGEQLINHLDCLKLFETPQDIWKEGLSCLSSSYAKPYRFLYSLLEKRKRSLIYSLKEKMRALIRTLQERKVQQAKEQ